MYVWQQENTDILQSLSNSLPKWTSLLFNWAAEDNGSLQGKGVLNCKRTSRFYLHFYGHQSGLSYDFVCRGYMHTDNALH